MSKPILKILSGPSPTQKGVSEAVSSGLASVFSAPSQAAGLAPHDLDGLVQALHFKNQVAKAALKRSRWFGGRFYNKFSGEEPDYVPLSGTHMRQALSAAGIEPPDFIVVSGKYQLRLDISETAVKALLDEQALNERT
ncbi:MAG: hypothetical protein ABJM43_04345 [Paracoccaceae bacterium]